MGDLTLFLHCSREYFHCKGTTAKPSKPPGRRAQGVDQRALTKRSIYIFLHPRRQRLLRLHLRVIPAGHHPVHHLALSLGRQVRVGRQRVHRRRVGNSGQQRALREFDT